MILLMAHELYRGRDHLFLTNMAEGYSLVLKSSKKAEMVLKTKEEKSRILDLDRCLRSGTAKDDGDDQGRLINPAFLHVGD